MNQKKIICIDASSLKKSACGLRMFLTVVEGWSSREESNDLLTGTCFHKAVELFAKDDNAFAAQEEALKHWDENIENCEIKYTAKYLNRDYLAATLMQYFLHAKTNDIFTRCQYVKVGGQTLAEMKFSIPMYADEDVEVLLQGTIDGIFQIKGGCPCIGDWKTTRARDPEEYFSGYTMSTQLRVYLWAVQWLTKHYPDSAVAQVFKTAPKIGAFIYGAFLTKDSVEFKQSQIYQYGKQDMERFEKLLKFEVSKLVVAYKNFVATGIRPLPDGLINNACQEVFGSYCSYFGACSSCVDVQTTDEVALFEAKLKNNFVKKDYRPLSFGGGEKKITLAVPEIKK